ncbi:MAG: glycosyltransferase [Clostridia bacterium]|nr:glycosyltransferase [Clostridia bacterium]
MDLISVIVPIYKVEKYLDECVESIVNQTYTNLEIILVDDGSPDNCPQMCDKWAARDSRIKVIHKQNGGLSDARNAGMAMATGEYIGFVDSDDWISEDMYSLLFKNIKDKSSDISACGISCFYDDNDTDTFIMTPSDEYVLDSSTGIKAIVKEDILKQPVWYKLYKKEIIKDIPFKVGKCHEDVFWSYQAIGNAKCISIIPEPCYYYRQRNDSIMGSNFSMKHFDSIEAKVQRVEYIQTHFPEHTDLAKFSLWFSCIYAMQMALIHLEPKQISMCVHIINKTRKICLPLSEHNFLSFKQRIWLFFSKISLLQTCKIRNRFRIGI